MVETKRKEILWHLKEKQVQELVVHHQRCYEILVAIETTKLQQAVLYLKEPQLAKNRHDPLEQSNVTVFY